LIEATSSLDAVNEAEVEKALQNASKGRYVILACLKPVRPLLINLGLQHRHCDRTQAAVNQER
jgi:hypothetical protein